MKRNIFIGLFLVSIFGFCGFAQAAQEAWTDQFLREFKEIKSRIDSLEKQQQEIIANDQKILEEIERTKVWARR